VRDATAQSIWGILIGSARGTGGRDAGDGAGGLGTVAMAGLRPRLLSTLAWLRTLDDRP